MMIEDRLNDLRSGLESLEAQLYQLSETTSDLDVKTSLHNVLWYVFPALLELTESHPDEK